MNAIRVILSNKEGNILKKASSGLFPFLLQLEERMSC